MHCIDLSSIACRRCISIISTADSNIHPRRMGAVEYIIRVFLRGVFQRVQISLVSALVDKECLSSVLSAPLLLM